MGIFSRKPKIDSKEQFLDIIRKAYNHLTQGQVPSSLVHEVSIGITEHYYDQYKRFRKQYPKSAKRYSSFQTKDLDHPNTYDIIIKLLKERVGNEYDKYATLFLNKTMDELKAFEKNRENFYKMF